MCLVQKYFLFLTAFVCVVQIKNFVLTSVVYLEMFIKLKLLVLVNNFVYILSS